MKNIKIEQCLRQIAAKHGGILRPQDVVAEARSPKHILHSKFEWDNTKAAEEHRIWQARQLISVTVEIIGDAAPSPVFVSLSSDRGHGGGYRATGTVLSDALLREQLLRDALADLNRFQLKYRNLRALAEVFASINKVKKKVA